MKEENKTQLKLGVQSRKKHLPKFHDIQSAIEYTSTLMYLTEKGKIALPVAKQLTYGVQVYTSLLKMEKENNEIRYMVEFGAEQMKHETAQIIKNFGEIVLSVVGSENFQKIAIEMSRTEKEVQAKINSKKKEIYENIKNRSPYKITEYYSETPENIVEMIKSAVSVLPEENFQDVVKFINNKNSNPLTYVSA